MPPKKSAVRFYKKGEVNRGHLHNLCKEKLGVSPFEWQLDAGEETLCGGDVILDAGCGCGKSLVFQLPVLADENSMVMVVLPLSALMLEQAQTSKLSTVAVCSETIDEVGREVLYEQILAGKYQVVLISPEIAISPDFSQRVLSQQRFYSRLRSVCIDEAHCINVWGGGGFRPDYAELGSLRGRIPKNVPFLVASATFPSHVLDDVRRTLKLAEDALTVAVSNDRPNVALSVRTMKHSIDSKGDLRFIIPEGARTLEDIPVTAVYCNERLATEDIRDTLVEWAKEQGIEGAEDGIVFYHAKVGRKRKREIEEKLRKGEVRVICCTDAVGMGCDLRNIERVVLWGLPPTFCALVQRAGRAMRDMTKDGEAILIVSSAIQKRDVEPLAEELEEAAERSVADEADNDFAAAVREIAEEHSVSHLGEEAGVRVHADEPPAEIQSRARGKKVTKVTFNSRETQFLIRFARAEQCLRAIWNEFFRNTSKLPLNDPSVTLFRDRPGLRCCSVCEADKFPVEDVVVAKAKGLARGRKRQLPPGLPEKLRDHLKKWREYGLYGQVFGIASESISTISGAALLGDDVIEKICMSGRYIRTEEDLIKSARWGFGFDDATQKLNVYGRELLKELGNVYDIFDIERRSTNPGPASAPIPPEQFYGQSSKPAPKPQPRPKAATAKPSASSSKKKQASTSAAPLQPVASTSQAPIRRSARQAAKEAQGGSSNT